MEPVCFEILLPAIWHRMLVLSTPSGSLATDSASVPEAIAILMVAFIWFYWRLARVAYVFHVLSIGYPFTGFLQLECFG